MIALKILMWGLAVFSGAIICLIVLAEVGGGTDPSEQFNKDCISNGGSVITSQVAGHNQCVYP